MEKTYASYEQTKVLVAALLEKGTSITIFDEEGDVAIFGSTNCNDIMLEIGASDMETLSVKLGDKCVASIQLVHEYGGKSSINDYSVSDSEIKQILEQMI